MIVNCEVRNQKNRKVSWVYYSTGSTIAIIRITWQAHLAIIKNLLNNNDLKLGMQDFWILGIVQQLGDYKNSSK